MERSGTNLNAVLGVDFESNVMGQTCIKDHRPQNSIDHERGWLNGCAQCEIERLRALLEEWEDGVYDGQDFLRRVRLALHGKDGLQLVPNG